MTDGFGGDITAAQLQLRQVEQAIIEAMPAAVSAGAQILKREAANMAPVRSRKLVGSAKDEPGEVDSISATHRVYFDAFYAKFQEFGTSHHGAQPFLGPAAELNKQAIEDAIADVIRPAAGDAILRYRGTLTSSGGAT
jgi:HK97 gp10 family phage protein